MSKLGRNESCPCGSGLKYKRCCLQKQTAMQPFPWNDPNVDADWLKIRRTEGELVPKLIAFAKKHYGDHAMMEAWDEFTLWTDTPTNALEFDNGFIPWFVFNWVPDNTEREPGESNMPEAPVAITYANENPSLDAYQKRYITAICEEPYSFFAILDAVPGKSLTLRDILLGREFAVKERQASTLLKRGNLVFGRVLPLDNQAVIVGMMPLVIPSRYHLELLEFRDSLVKNAKKMKLPLNRQLLNELDIELREIYYDIAEELENPQMPVLLNTDGELLEYIEIHYRLKCSPQEALQRLETLAIEEFREHILEDAVYDSAGKLQSVTFDWHKRGNKKHPEWSNTVLGHVTIKGDSLVIDVNSEKRSKKIQSEIKKRLGSDATLVKATTESIEKKMADFRKHQESPAERKRRQEDEEFQSKPEVQVMLKEQMEKHWNAWLDQPVPALGGKSPKQAARTPRGREKLDALLLDFESRSARQKQEALRPDIAGLREKLGLNQAQLPRKKTGT